jgi:hypothetical protein
MIESRAAGNVMRLQMAATIAMVQEWCSDAEKLRWESSKKERVKGKLQWVETAAQVAAAVNWDSSAGGSCSELRGAEQKSWWKLQLESSKDGGSCSWRWQQMVVAAVEKQQNDGGGCSWGAADGGQQNDGGGCNLVATTNGESQESATGELQLEMAADGGSWVQWQQMVVAAVEAGSNWQRQR